MRRFAGFAAAALIAVAAGAQMRSLPTSRVFSAAKTGYYAHHTDDAVKWVRWGTPAFYRARSANQPIFVSIGFTGCRFCEIMHRESFATSAIAEVLNTRYVPVLLDADEQPDVVAALTAYVRSSTNSDAPLPVNVVLSPDLWPLLGSGYIGPNDLRSSLVAFNTRWSADSEALLRQASEAVAHARIADVPAPEPLPHAGEPLAKALHQTFDARNGGFGTGPKTIQPVLLDFLLRRAARGDDDSREVAMKTLTGITRGGIYDRIGGGFHRRTLDAEWHIPEFTKRLPDQALMVFAFLDAWHLRHERNDERVVRSTLDYLLRDIRDKRGALFSGEGGESVVAVGGPRVVYGAYYTWPLDEVRKLSEKSADLVDFYFNVKADGNVPPELDPRHDLTGRNVLYIAASDLDAQKRFGITNAAQLDAALTAPLDRMLVVRSHRPPPELDDQSIAGWNGLAISAFARAATAFDEPRYAAAAAEIARFIESRLYDPKNKRLQRSAEADAIPEDYAFVIQGLLDLYEATYQYHWLGLAIDLQKRQDDLFWSAASLRYVGQNALPPSVRDLAPDRDRDCPAANGVAAMNLERLSAITGDPALRARAEAIFRSFAFAIRDTPAELASVITAFEANLSTPAVIVVAGNPGARETSALLAEYHRAFPPPAVLIVMGSTRDQAELSKLAPVAASVKLTDHAAAYVCHGSECGSAITDPAVLGAAIQGASRR